MYQVESCGCTVEWRQLSHDCKRAKAWYSFNYFSCWVWVYFYIQYNGPSFGSETIIDRQATRHDCLPCWLGDGDKWSEIVSCEEKSFVLGRLVQQPRRDKHLLYRQAQHSNQGRTPFRYFHWVPICLSFNSRRPSPVFRLRIHNQCSDVTYIILPLAPLLSVGFDSCNWRMYVHKLKLHSA